MYLPHDDYFQYQHDESDHSSVTGDDEHQHFENDDEEDSENEDDFIDAYAQVFYDLG